MTIACRGEVFMSHPRRRIYGKARVPATSTIAIHRPYRPYTSALVQRRTYPSADEINAAKVLLNLSPKEIESQIKIDYAMKSKPHHENQPQYHSQPPPMTVPETIAIPSTYARSWEHFHGTTLSLLPHVSDHSGDSNSCSEDESSTLADEPCSKASTPAAAPVTSGNGQWMAAWGHGSISLSLPEDADVLSPLHCFMRRYCVEVFSATPGDLSTPRYGKSHGVKVVTGQVGIRCLYCKHRSPKERPERATCFPSSLKNIYHSIETWQRRHSLACTDIPTWVRKSITELMQSSKARAGGRRQYWEDSARRLGMIDSPHGVRFSRTPGDLGLPQQVIMQQVHAPSKPVVNETDRELVTNYLYLLMDQMQTCRFTEEDRAGGRSKIKDNEVGFPGMQCKHCQGRAGFGRYFPNSVNALALANSDRNIFNHIQKCRRCPQDTKSRLIQLSKDQTPFKNRRGLRKIFFQKVWNRMHSPRS